ncbi:hypothetical protein BDV93DRAFT_461414, partial [Ceratobasidium sp. AG-I]
PSKLMCGLTDDFCLESALLYAGTNGLFMDATWRGMNQNFAPTTFLLGVDRHNHATPVAVLISQDVKAETLAEFLRTWMAKITSHARRKAILERQEDEISQIQAAAKMVAAKKWSPAFFMIDKDQAERNACKQVFPNVEVRVCQFHAMDAIQRWLKAAHPLPVDLGKKTKSKSRKTFIVPEDAHKDIQNAFRLTQRCRDAQDFTTYRNAFDEAIGQICAAFNIPQQKDPICQYFNENFWSQDWRDSITDIGLPLGATRDHILNTNNYAESFIKTFKYTILGMRRNKRIDTLVIILADILLPYYRIWQNDRVKHAKDYTNATQLGYEIWQNGLVQKTTGNQFQVNDMSK